MLIRDGNNCEETEKMLTRDGNNSEEAEKMLTRQQRLCRD